MTRNGATLAVLAVTVGAWLSPACGGDSESDEKKATGGTGGSEAGIIDVVSEPDAKPEAPKCVAADCPGLGQFVQGCCKPDDTCGYDGNAIGLGCVSQEEIQGLLEGGFDVQVPQDATDPNCPDYTVFGGVKLEGCCPGTGMCGVYAPFINQCYDWGALPPQVPKPDNIVPTPCGSGPPDGGGGDASSDASPADASPADATPADAGAG